MAPTTTLHATLPDDWLPYAARDVAVVARPPVDSAWFCPTLLLAQEQAPRSVSLHALLEATAAKLDELGDDVEILGDRYHVDDRHERVSRLVSFDVHGQGRRVAQLQCFIAPLATELLPVGTRCGDRPVVQFVGTCAFDELDRHGATFVRVIDSIRFVRDERCAS